MKKAELMKWAQYFNVRGRSKMTRMQLKAEIYELTRELDFWVDMKPPKQKPYQEKCNPKVCRHNAVKDFEALEAYVAARHRGHVCRERLIYLWKQVKRFKKERGLSNRQMRTVLAQKRKGLFRNIRRGEGIVAENLINCFTEYDLMWNRVAEEDKCWDQFHEHMEGNYTKAIKKMHQDRRLTELHELEQELPAPELTKMEKKIYPTLAKAQKEYDNPNIGTKDRPLCLQTYRVMKKAAQRIHDLRFKEKKLSYEEWARLSNWAYRLLSRPKRFTVYDPTREDIWAKIAEQDMYLWETGWQEGKWEDNNREPWNRNGDKEQQAVLNKLEKKYDARLKAWITKRYTDMSKVQVLKVETWTEVTKLKAEELMRNIDKAEFQINLATHNQDHINVRDWSSYSWKQEKALESMITW